MKNLLKGILTRLLPVLLLTTSLVTGCGSAETPQDTATKVVAQNNANKEVEEDNTPKGLNPLTGEEVPLTSLERRPLAVMIENSPAARPQSGLDRADIIYEMLAEGAITRFMGIYYGSDTKELGPVRSARSYFIERALEYDAIYAHAGGSPEAKVDLKRWKVSDFDEFANAKAYYRSKKRKAPHNLYGNTLVMWPYAMEKKGFDREVKVPQFDFLTKDKSIDGGQSATQVKINYPRAFSIVDYQYQPDEAKYVRFQANKPHVDKGNGKQLAARNIIIQYVNTKTVDDEGRLDMKMIGSGKGMLITQGKVYNIKWSKPSLRATTKFIYNGELIKLSSGQTWIQVVPMKTKVEVN